MRHNKLFYMGKFISARVPLVVFAHGNLQLAQGIHFQAEGAHPRRADDTHLDIGVGVNGRDLNRIPDRGQFEQNLADFRTGKAQ